MEHFARRSGSYILLRSEQLVGAALIIVVKEELTRSIRSVEATTKKVRRAAMARVIKADRRLVYLA
jgi:hypothetical protein